jgi:hypothetical protein
VREAIAETAAGCTERLVSWRPDDGVLDARVEFGPGRKSVATRIAAGEDVRAVVCLRAPAATTSAGLRTRCRSASVPGLRPRHVRVPAPAGVRAVSVAVKLAAESNRSRKTVVVGRAALGR